MNKLMKKCLTGSIALIVAVSVMTGCSNSKNDLPPDTNGTQGTQETTQGNMQQTTNGGTTQPNATTQPNTTTQPNANTNTQTDNKNNSTVEEIPNYPPYEYKATAPKDESKITLENFNKVSDNMKYDEVLTILGGPTEMKDAKASNGADVKFCTWKSKDGKEYVVTFNNGLVSGKMSDK